MLDPIPFVSLGPGDPESVTLGALGALRAAERIYCPATAGVSRAGEILLALGIDPANIRPFDVPMRADRAAALEAYRAAAETLAEDARAGIRVAVAAEGDAGFYATTDYIAERLAVAGIPTRRLAGVPAFIAAGALAGIPVARGDEGLEVAPGRITCGQLAEKLTTGRTVVVMKASRCEAALKQAAKELEGVEFHYFENIGVAGAEYYTADRGEILSRAFPYFSLMIVRKP